MLRGHVSCRAGRPSACRRGQRDLHPGPSETLLGPVRKEPGRVILLALVYCGQRPLSLCSDLRDTGRIYWLKGTKRLRGRCTLV